MKFCDNCENMLYLKIEECDNAKSEGSSEEASSLSSDTSSTTESPKNSCKLTYKCIKCNESYPSSEEDSCVFNVNFNLDNIKKNSFINEFIYNDITLPKAEGIKCPNQECPDSKPQIVYIQYDKEKMNFIYVCLSCHREGISPHIW
tara:strand:+ start:287 stop:724 length:438 start_codon:yes stop_codon:yes gene_type:complete